MKQEKALEIAFPAGATVERKNIFFTEEEKKAVQKISKTTFDQELVTYYVGKSSAGIAGYVFFETHTVRTMPETFMVVLNSQGAIHFVEMLAFHEPQDYKPPKRWLGLFKDRKLNDDLWVKRGIRNVAGATLTAQAITDGIRRVLAVMEVIKSKEKK